MSPYFDSSVVTKWYLPEPDSAAALRLRARFAPPAVLTHLHRVELTTAWQQKVYRKELPAAVVARALGDLGDDVAAGIWIVPAYDLVDVHSRAELLSQRHAATLGVRSLDILHVAAALALDAQEFVTNDDRQGLLAQAVGLKLVRLRKS